MDAASTLHSLGDGASVTTSPTSPQQPAPTNSEQVLVNNDAAAGDQQEVKEEMSPKTTNEGEGAAKRYLPEHKKPDAAPTFPEKLMKLMCYAEKQGDDFCVAWMDDGKSFIIRKPDEFTRNVVPKFFKPTKFSSFTRKLYRWGFRQVNRGIGPDDPIIFGNECFQRNDEERMTKMRSITAAATRKEEQKNANASLLYGAGMKHPLEGGFDETTHKRLMIEHMYQHKAGMMAQNRGYYGNGMNNGGPMSLTNALRPNMGMGSNMMQGDYMGYQGGPPGPNTGYQGGPNTGYQGGPVPNQGMHPLPHQGPYNMQSGGSQTNNGYPNPSTTAEIVNAAIAALRYAN